MKRHSELAQLNLAGEYNHGRRASTSGITMTLNDYCELVHGFSSCAFSALRSEPRDEWDDVLSRLDPDQTLPFPIRR